MKNLIKLAIIMSIFSFSAFAKVEICRRAAELPIDRDHMWIKTDRVEAGMGNDVYNEQFNGIAKEDKSVIRVFIVSHENDSARICNEYLASDEDCINSELEVGKELGIWGPTNHCQTFVAEVLRKCEIASFKEKRLDYERASSITSFLKRNRRTASSAYQSRKLELTYILDKYDGKMPPNYDKY